MKENLFFSKIFHLKKKNDSAVFMVLMLFFLPFNAFSQQSDSVITVQGGASVYGEFYVAPSSSADKAKIKTAVRTIKKPIAIAKAQPKVVKTVKLEQRPKIKTTASPQQLYSGNELLAYSQQIGNGKSGTVATNPAAKVIPASPFITKPLFLSEKKQATALRCATSSSFVDSFESRGPPA